MTSKNGSRGTHTPFSLSLFPRNDIQALSNQLEFLEQLSSSVNGNNDNVSPRSTDELPREFFTLTESLLFQDEFKLDLTRLDDKSRKSSLPLSYGKLTSATFRRNFIVVPEQEKSYGSHG